MDESRLEDFTIERKVGQLFQVGFQGTEPGEDIRELVREYHVGGVIYFGRNVQTPQQTATLSASLQSLAMESTGVPLLVSTDQEGGNVTRIPFGTTPPGGMAVGATADPGLASDLGAAIGAELRALGINMNFAPVVDVNVDPANPVIGSRSYGSNPDSVAELGAATATALQDAGVVACAKHFPGHGDTAVDSHHGLPVVDQDRDRLESVELPPFQAAIRAGVDAIMTAHVHFPAFEPDGDVPATLSESVLTGLLREELGHDGLVVTDCMEMDAIADRVGTVDGAVRAVAAGADAVLVSHTPSLQKQAIDAVVEAVRRGEIPETRIDEAVHRVLRLKHERVDPGIGPNIDDAMERVVETSRRVARAAVTLLRDEADWIPVGTDGVVLWEFGIGQVTPAEDDRGYATIVADLLRDRGYDVRRHAFGGDTEGPAVRDGEAVLVVTGGSVRVDERRAVRKGIADGAPVVVMAVSDPYDLQAFPEAPTVLTTYDYSRPMLEAGVDVLTGREPPRGTLPVELS